eukprot:COSAG05_NODE_6553_length_939_cov_1.130952_2_plen_65_part_00
MGDDLLWAMSTLGFENYTEPLKTYLFRYREVTIKSEKESSDAAAAKEAAAAAGGGRCWNRQHCG